MTGQRDIDRTLDAWFVDGPSVMPDRLFDDVLDQVERTPQRPFARLRLRLNDMNPNIRWLTAAAAALVVVLVALATINRPADDTFGASSSPIVSPSSPAAEVPTELQTTWLSGPRSITGFDADAGVSLKFTATAGFSMNGSLTDRPDRMQASVEILDGNTVRIVNDNATQDCGAGEAGEYTWSLSASGETLVLTAVTDACANRLEAVPGTYWRMDCPTEDDNCIGKIDAGTYGSQFLDPFVLGEAWSPRYGALTYTVPGGWVNRGDWPEEFALAPEGAPETTHVTIVSDVVAASRADNCREDQDPDAGTTAEEIVAALSRPGVTVSTPVPVTIGGLSGLRVDLALDDGWTTPCPWSADRPYAMLFVDRAVEEGFAWGLDGDTQMRTYLLNIEADRAILIDIETATEAEQADVLDEATSVVESYVFTP
jgi:hypothetical protein